MAALRAQASLFPNTRYLLPNRTRTLNLPLSTNPQTDSAVWLGQHEVEVRIVIDYRGGEPPTSKKYKYAGKFDATIRKFSVIENE
jgi:hypothetical protein